MSSLSDHAYLMHLHLYPHIAQLNLCLSSLGLVFTSARSGQELLCLFCRPRFSTAMVLNSGIPWSTVPTPGFALFQGKNAITDYCFCGPPDSPWLGLAQRVFQYPCMRPAGNLCTHGFLPGSLEVRWAVFQQAVGDIAGAKVRFIVTFFSKSINSPTDNLNAFSWPLL